MKKREAKAVKFICVGERGEVLSNVYFNVRLSSMYIVMDCLRETEQDFINKYHVEVVKWGYRILSSNELKALNIEV